LQERKGCCFAGQIALFRNKVAAVPEDSPATGSFGEVQLLYKNINPIASGTRESPEARHNIQELCLL